MIGANILYALKKPDDYFNVAWRINKESGGPLLINIIHDIDTLRYFFGDVDFIQAHITNHFRGNDVEDAGVINFIFKNQAIATIFLTDNSPAIWAYEICAGENPRFHPSHEDCYFFFGEKASIAFPSMQQISYKKELGVGWLRPYLREYVPTERADVYLEEVRHFCSVLNGDEASRITAEDGLETMRIIEAIHESSKQKKAIFL
jgi:predicted dehydrogenase